MHLRQALAAMWTDLKASVRVTYARLHPEYEVLDLGGESIVLPPIDVDDFDTEAADGVESGFREALSDDAPTRQVMDMPKTGFTLSDGEQGEPIVLDRSHSMDGASGEWNDGALAQAAQQGSVLLLDEVNEVPPEKR